MIKSPKLLLTAIVVILLLTLSEKTQAQTVSQNSNNTWRLGFGIEPGVPLGDGRDYSNFTLGANARLQYDIKQSFSLMLTSGYTHNFAKDQIIFQDIVYKLKDSGIIPVKVGAKVFIPHHFYFSGEVGAGFETEKHGSTNLILSPGFGYASNSGLDIGTRYDHYSANGDASGIIVLRIAYGFKL